MASKEKLGKILIVAGSADAMMNYQMQLSNFTVETALNAEAATDLLDDLEPDVIIIDEKLPGTTGVELAQWIRSDQASPHYYSILLVAHSKGKDPAELLKTSGADAACHYDHTKQDLALRVDLLMRYKRLHDKSTALTVKLSHTKETIRDLEDQDSITRLYNLSYVTSRLDKEIRHAERFQATLSLMVISISGFYNLALTRGTAAMIKVLQQVGNDLVHITRADDIVGRSWAGEFYLILPETKQEGSDNLKERILKATADKLYGPEGEQLQLEFHFGSASYTGEINSTFTAKDMVRKAEEALSAALLEKTSQKIIKVAN